MKKIDQEKLILEMIEEGLKDLNLNSDQIKASKEIMINSIKITGPMCSRKANLVLNQAKTFIGTLKGLGEL